MVIVNQPEILSRRIMDAAEPGIIRMELHKIGWIQQRLFTGDYYFFSHDYKKIGIERKTVEDLLGSIGDKLGRQLENSLEHYDTVVLMIEGSWQKVSPNQNLITQRGVVYQTWDMVWNYLHQFKRKGIITELTINEGHTIHRLNELYALYQKTYSLSGKSNQFADDRVIAFPSGVRGKTGMAILEGRSLAEVGLMDTEELEEVEGIGKKKAQSVFDHFNRRANEKLVRSEENIREQSNNDHQSKFV